MAGPWWPALLLVAGAAALRAERPWPEGDGPAAARPDALLGALPPELARQVTAFVPGPWRAAIALGLSTEATIVGDEGLARTLRGRRGLVNDIRFFPQGDRLITAHSDGACVVWCAASGQQVRVILHSPDPTASVYEVRIFPDGVRFVAVGSDMAATIWNATSGAPLQRLHFRALGQHHAVRVFPLADKLVTGVTAGDGPAVIWDAAFGHALKFVGRLDERIVSLELSLCGRKLVTAGSQGVLVWSAATGRMQLELSRHIGGIFRVGISADGAHVVGGDRQKLYVWDGRAAELLREMPVDVGLPVFELLPSRGRVVVMLRSEAAIFNASSGERLMPLHGDLGGDFQRVAVSRDGQVVAACGARATAESLTAWAAVHDASTGRVLRALNHTIVQNTWACCVAASPRGSMLEWLTRPSSLAAS